MTFGELALILGFKVDQTKLSEAENQIQSLKSTATRLLGTIGIGFSLYKINALAEEVNGIGDSITYAVKGLGDAEEIQKQILSAANATKTSYGNMADSVTQLIETNKDLFPVDEAIEFATLTQKMLVAAGKGESEAASLQTTISRVFQTGEVTSGVLRNLYTNAPEFISALSDSMGVARDTLYDLADAGQLTGKTVKEAILASAGSIEEAFAGLDYSISDSLLIARNQWGYWLNDMNSTLGITETIARGITRMSNIARDACQRIQTRLEWLAEKLGGTEVLLKLIGVTVGSIIAVFGAATILSTLKKITGFLNAGFLKLFAIVAVIVMIGLLVEDFVSFMKGEDSLLGSLLEKAGVDTDEFREAIINTWNTVKRTLTAIWSFLKSTATTIWNGLKEFWAEHGESVMASLTQIWDAIKSIFISVWNAIKGEATETFNELKAFWDEWGGKIKAAFGVAWDGIKNLFTVALDIIANIFTVFAALLSGDWSTLWESLKNIVTGIWDAIVTALSTVLNVLWTLFGDTLTNIWNKVVGVFTNIWTSVVEKVTGIKDSIIEGFQAAIDWITSLPAQALQWGKDIIQSIIDGIKSKIAAIGEAVSGVATTIKNFLGFSEPEEGPLSDFHTYMPDMMKLMQTGIEQNKGKVTGAIRLLADDMSVLASSKIAQPKTVNTMTSTSSTRTIVMNNNFSQQFNGDAVGQKKSAAAMETAASDVTGQLARALAYAK